MQLHDYEAFIFDMDGTLVDSGKYHAQAFADAVFEQSGYRLTPDEQHEFFASHSNQFSGVLNERHGLSLVPGKVLSRKRRRIQEIFVAELFAGAHEFLELWYGKKPLALATNSPMAFVKVALEEADILKYFQCVTTSDEIKRRKPDPEIVEVTLHKLAVDPSRTMVFEDQLIGIQAARATGAHVIGVDNGQPVIFPADVAVYNWNELIKLSGMY